MKIKLYRVLYPSSLLKVATIEQCWLSADHCYRNKKKAYKELEIL